jgi:ribonuclease BN (tRNA processing enzyme)
MTAVAAASPRSIAAQGGRTRLILLGTGGGPRPRTASSAPAQVIVSNDVAYVIDCGDGVARQLAFAGVPLTSLRHIFITHQHSDHNADYGNLIWLAWAAGLRTRVDAWGPPPLARMTKLFFEMNKSDIDTRISNEGRVPLVPLVHVHERRAGGVVMSDDNVTVTSTLVDHPPVVPAFAYRFDARDRSIVVRPSTASWLACPTRQPSKRASSPTRHQQKTPAASPRTPESGRWSSPTSCRPTIPNSPTRPGWRPRDVTSKDP